MFFQSSLQMYKVFFNECLILLDPENKNLLLGNIQECVEIQKVDDFFALLERLDKQKHVEQPVYKCLIEKDLVAELLGEMNQIPAAGGIVRNLRGDILFIRRFGKWDLPKGKIEKGETIAEAALREVEEECGIGNLQIDKQLLSTFHIYRSPYLSEPDNWVWKETFWFEMLYTGNETPKPQTEEDITEIRWFGEDRLGEVYPETYGNLKELLSNYLV